MQQYDKNLNEDQKIVLEMKLFESILNSDFNIRKTILQSEESWLNENLLNHFKGLVNNFMELETENMRLKTDWQSMNISSVKVNLQKQKDLYNELKWLKNHFKYLKLSKFSTHHKWSNINLESNEKLKEIHSETVEQVDAEILKLRQTCKTTSENSALELWNYYTEKVL